MVHVRITLGGRSFELVCVRRSGVAVYRGDSTYLRLGPGLAEELAAHRHLHAHGFPVARILQEGTHDGVPYMVEESLGAGTLGDRFSAEVDAHGTVGDASFSLFQDVVARHARAQAAMAVTSSRADADDFARVVGVSAAEALVPELGERIRVAFDRAAAAVHPAPAVLVHGDLHPYNTCAGGVIDLEGTGRGPAGYDVVTAAFVPMLCDEGATTGRAWFSSGQIDGYLSMIDDAFRACGHPRPSTYLDQLLVCRAIALCAARHPLPAVWLARRRMLRAVLDRCDEGEAVGAWLLSRAGEPRPRLP